MTGGGPNDSNRDRGSATVYGLLVGFMLCLGTLVATQATTIIRLQHEVASAADLAAVAASAAAVRGEDGCEAAQVVARHNGADVVACAMDLEVATVTTRARSQPMWGQQFTAERRARAAPSDYIDPES